MLYSYSLGIFSILSKILQIMPVKLFLYFVVIYVILSVITSVITSGITNSALDKDSETKKKSGRFSNKEKYDDKVYLDTNEEKCYYDKFYVDINHNQVNVKPSRLSVIFEEDVSKTEEDIENKWLIQDFCLPGDYLLDKLYIPHNNSIDFTKYSSEKLCNEYDDDDQVVITDEFDNDDYLYDSKEITTHIDSFDKNVWDNRGKELIERKDFSENSYSDVCFPSKIHNISTENYENYLSIENTPDGNSETEINEADIPYDKQKEAVQKHNFVNDTKTSFLDDCIVPELIPNSISEITGIKNILSVFDDDEDENGNEHHNHLCEEKVLIKNSDQVLDNIHGDNVKNAIQKYVNPMKKIMKSAEFQMEGGDDRINFDLLIAANIILENTLLDLQRDLKIIKLMLKNRIKYDD